MWLKTYYLFVFPAISISVIRGQDGGPLIGDSLNSFSINLLTKTAQEAGSPVNVAISPYTVWTLLSTVAEGARKNTAKELDTVLHIPEDKNWFRRNFKNLTDVLLKSSKGVEFDISNSIFTRADQKLNHTFRQTARKYYGVEVLPTDFTNQDQATRAINDYIAKFTNQRIPTFLYGGELEEAEIFMVSVLFFKGQWQIPFNKSATNTESFFDETGSNELGKVDLMFQKGYFTYTRVDEIRAHAVELPYGNGEKMSMVVLLPYMKESIMSVLNSLNNGQSPFRSIISKLKKAKEDFGDDDVLVYLPKFKIRSTFNLNKVMQAMGIKDLFDWQNANLLNMFPHYLHITRLMQSAEIEVNEEGTIASSATGASFTYKTTPPQFKVNRPFLYFIIDKVTDTIIFAGKITNPNALTV